MEAALWAKVHGASTHFPLALALGSAAFDAAGCALAGRPVARDLRAAGYWTLLLGALGSLSAVASGLLMTRGEVLGHGALRMHHLFVWPAFALLVALATWRVGRGGWQPERRIPAGYLLAVGVDAGLMLAAGYWGGEMLLAS